MTTMGGVSHPVHDGHRHAAFIKCVASNNIFVAEHSRRPVKGALIVQGESAQGPSGTKAYAGFHANAQAIHLVLLHKG